MLLDDVCLIDEASCVGRRDEISSEKSRRRIGIYGAVNAFFFSFFLLEQNFSRLMHYILYIYAQTFSWAGKAKSTGRKFLNRAQNQRGTDSEYK